MRIFSIISAILVVIALYLMVFERERVFAFAGRDTPSETETVESAAPVTAASRRNEKGETKVSVVAIKSIAQTIDSAVVLRGRTEAMRQVVVRSETSGLIISDPLRAGTQVNADDVLCQIDPGTRQTALAESKARLLEAQARLPEAESRLPSARAVVDEANARVIEAQARVAEAEINETAASRLSKDGFASETRVKSARAALESARAGVVAAKSNLAASSSGIASANSGIEAARAGILAAEARVASAEKAIEQLTITAPFAGLLETDTAEIGSLLQPGGECATVIQLNPIKLVGFVPETDVARVNPKANAGAELADGQRVIGQVGFLSRSADETTRTFRVEILADNIDLKIRDGQTATIIIESDGASAHLVPQSALTLNDNGELGVRTAKDDVTRFVGVEIIRDTIKGVWVSGLPQEADIIVVGQEFVTEGVAVAVTFREDM